MNRHLSRGSFLASSASLALSASAHASGVSAHPFLADIEADYEPLKATFNSARDHVRILMLLSPTCDFCLRGALEVQTEVLDIVRDRQISAFAIWVPELKAARKDVAAGERLLPDYRVRHYWDQHEVFGAGLEPLLQTSGPAWAVYLLFKDEMTWTKLSPPEPTFWMHQLAGVSNAPRFDPLVFRNKVEQLLSDLDSTSGH